MKSNNYTPDEVGGVACVRCNGIVMPIEDILLKLNTLEQVKEIILKTPELNMSNYDHDQVAMLNSDVCEAWAIIVDSDDWSET